MPWISNSPDSLILVVSACLFVAPLPSRAEDQTSKPAASQTTSQQPETTLAPAAVQTGDGPLDWVMEKLPSGSDRWSTEKIQEEAQQTLATLAVAVRSLDVDVTAIEAVAAPGFQARSPFCGPERVVLDRPDLQVVRRLRDLSKKPTEDDLLTASTFADELRRLLRVASSLEKAKFKVFQVRARSRGRPGATLRVLFEGDGVASRGGFVQFRWVWELDCVPGTPWRIERLLPLELEQAWVARRAFSEVTAATFGGCASYREQLRVGLGEWRQRIDSASGIDIYGHQGVAVGDYDGDGWEDVYVSQPSGLPNRLYRNRGDGTFEDTTQQAGVGVLDTTGGSLFLDVDGDGDEDILAVSFFEVLVFENLGDGRFRRRKDSGLRISGERGASSLGCAAADYDSDGDVDLYVFCYIFWAGAGSKVQTSYPYPYHDANNGVPNFLFRNEGDFRFTDVTRESGMDVNNRRFTLAASWGDYDNDGDPDLYVANDFGRNNLYQNRGDGRFADVAEAAGAEDTGNGMSVVWEDYDNDGRLDLYVGNMWSSAGSRLASQPGFRASASPSLQPVYRRMARGNSLLRNGSGDRFEDVTLPTRVRFGRWSWSSLFTDYDGDGHEDLYIANGFVSNERKDDL